MTQVTPESRQQWLAGYTAPVPTAAWPCQDAGGQASDVLGSNHLSVVTFTPDFQQPGEGGRFAINLDGSERIAHPSETFLDLGAGPLSFWVRAELTEALTLARGLAGSAERYGLSFESGGDPNGVLQGFVQDDVTFNTQNLGTLLHHAATGIHNFIFIADPPNNLYRIISSLGMVIEEIDLAGNLSSTPTDLFGLGARPGVRTVQNFLYHYAAAWEGYALTDSDVASILSGGSQSVSVFFSDTKFPGNQGQWESTYSPPWPDLVIPAQDALGASEAVDVSGGGRNLLAVPSTGTITFGASGEGGRTSILFGGGGAHLLCQDTPFGDIDGNPISVWARVFVPEDWSPVNAPFFGKRGDSVNRWYTPGRGLSDQATIGLLVEGSDVIDSFTVKAMLTLSGKWADVIVVIDPISGLTSIRACAEGGPIVGGVTPWTPRTVITTDGFSVGAHSSANIANGYKVGYLAKWVNYALSDAEQREIFTFGSNLFYPGSGDIMAKTQFSSKEPLRITFPPFLNRLTGNRIISGDAVSFVVKQPDGAVLSPALTPTRDPDTHFWAASIPTNEFIEGEWLVSAVSDDTNALDQYQSFTWGDYVDSILEVHQAALGRWKISDTTLTLYEADGVSILKQFSLLDEEGEPSATRVFERDPL